MEMGIFGFVHSEGQVDYIFPMETFSDLFGEVHLFYLFSRQGCWSTQKNFVSYIRPMAELEIHKSCNSWGSDHLLKFFILL